MAKVDERTEVFEAVRELLAKQSRGMDVRKDEPGQYELYGKKPCTIGNKAMDGAYFASAVIRKASVALYFFPIYTHPDAFADLSPELRKCLKGKSCFHFKKRDPALLKQVRSLLTQGKKVYRAEGWL